MGWIYKQHIHFAMLYSLALFTLDVRKNQSCFKYWRIFGANLDGYLGLPQNLKWSSIWHMLTVINKCHKNFSSYIVVFRDCGSEIRRFELVKVSACVKVFAMPFLQQLLHIWQFLWHLQYYFICILYFKILFTIWC